MEIFSGGSFRVVEDYVGKSKKSSRGDEKFFRGYWSWVLGCIRGNERVTQIR